MQLMRSETQPMTDPSYPQPHRGVLQIEAYVPGRSGAGTTLKVFKLSSNETPLGPSAKAVAAYQNLALRLHEYPDGSAAPLRHAIAKTFGLDPDRVICGAGVDELLNLLADAYLVPGDEAIYTTHAFQMYSIVTLGSGATPVVAPESNLTADVDEIVRRITSRTKIVFLANPNNPTGTYLPFAEVRRLHALLPSTVLLVLDAAYAEYVRRNDYDAGIELVATNNNVVMLRTFSKVYGLAGLRLGWGYMPLQIIDALHRIRGPFNVSAPAIAAGVAALEDRSHVENSVLHNEVWRGWLTQELDKLSLDVTPSVGNFVLIHFADAKMAANVDSFLTERGLILRRVTANKLPNALRMTIGTEEANRLAVATLKLFLERNKTAHFD